MLIALVFQNTFMKQKGIIAAAAIATAGIATYLVRRKLRSRHTQDQHHSVADNNRHLTGVFAKAKSASVNK
jgi:hypothetical protein